VSVTVALKSSATVYIPGAEVTMPVVLEFVIDSFFFTVMLVRLV
jgi:hypothetical protein